MNIVTIRPIENGFLVTSGLLHQKKYFSNCEELFNSLLNKLEFKSKYFSGEYYGFVHVFKEPNETFTSPELEC